MSLRRVLMPLLAVACMVFTTGCIDVFSVRDALVREPDDSFEYRVVTKVEVEKEFSTTTSLGSSREEDRENIYIKGDTQWLVVDLWTQFRTVEIPEFLDDLLTDRPRYLDVCVLNARGDTIFSAHYNTTTDEDPVRFSNPGPGLWQVRYEARGIGHQSLDYHDAFSIRARAYEPSGA